MSDENKIDLWGEETSPSVPEVKGEASPFDDVESVVTELLSNVDSNIANANSNIDTINQHFQSFQSPEMTLPNLTGKDFPPDFISCVDTVLKRYKKLPVLDYEAIYKELDSLEIKISVNTTIVSISEELGKVQAVKDRVTEILMAVDRCYRIKERAVDILKESWVVFTTEKTADKRKSDSIYRLSEFDMDLAETDALLKTCTLFARNLDSLQEMLSRRLTCMQLQLKLRDVNRTSPDFDFSKHTFNPADFDVGTTPAAIEQTSKLSEFNGSEMKF